jgi:hypothetical protein
MQKKRGIKRTLDCLRRQDSKCIIRAVFWRRLMHLLKTYIPGELNNLYRVAPVPL